MERCDIKEADRTGVRQGIISVWIMELIYVLNVEKIYRSYHCHHDTLT